MQQPAKKRKHEESDSDNDSIESEGEVETKKTQTCDKCSGGNILTATSRAADNNYWTFPNGKSGEGYMPSFNASLGDSDGLSILLCLDCGKLQGVDLTTLKQRVLQLQDEE